MPSRVLAPDRVEPTALRDHLLECIGARSPLHRLHCLAEALDAFLAPRFVTTLALVTAVVLVVALLKV